MEGYEELLKRVREKLPDSILSKERFDVPKAKGHIQGNRTVINNFSQIVSTFGREQGHLLKYLQRELATPASVDGPRLILGRKINASLINVKLEQYAQEFVLCRECKKPDTKLMREEKVTFLKCTACGAKHPIMSKI